MPGNQSAPSKPDFKEFEFFPDLYLFLAPDLSIINASNAYLEATLSNREGITGKNVFEAFPDNPELRHADGVTNLRNSLNYVLKHKKPHAMAVQRYDVPRSDGKFEKKYWKPLNTPVLDKEGNVRYIIHKVVDVSTETEYGMEITDLHSRVESLSLEVLEGQKKFEAQLLELKALQETEEYNEQRFRMLLDNLPQIAWTSLPSGETSFFNKRWFEYTGLNYPQSIDKGFEKVIHPEDLNQCRQVYEAAMKKGIPYEMELRMRRGIDQAYRWFLVQSHPLRNKNNGITLWIGTLTDVHDRKTSAERTLELQQQESELHRKSEEQRQMLQKLFMQVPALICIVRGPDHTFELVNPALQNLLGQQDLIGKKMKEALPELEGQQILKIMDEVYRRGEEIIINEIPIQLSRQQEAPAQESYFNIAYRPTFDKDNKVDGIFQFGYEVTQQVKARKIIEDMNERTRLILGSLSMIAWTCDTDGTVDYFNDTWYKYSGMKPEELKLQGHNNYIYPEDLPKVREAWQQNAVKGKQIEAQFRVRRGSDGMYRWHLGRTLPITDSRGAIIKWVGTATDIHDQKLSNEELSQKNKELKKINTDLDNFIYTASHDLKAPISNIEGLLDTFSDAGITEEQKPIIDMMYQSISRLRNTIKDLTEITYVQKTAGEETERVSFHEMTAEVMDNIREFIEKNKAVIRLDLQVPDVRFSKKNLRSILYNLLSNAIKYRSPERPPEVFISTRTEKRCIVLTVSDNGLGIAPQNKHKVFGMFKRLHDHVEGTGIGLYIVKRMIENAGGRIEVESELGKGTSFRVYFRA